MRRILALATIALVALAPAGCSGVDAQQAQSLLDQSTVAMAKVKSVSFAMRMWTSGGPDGTDFSVLMHGGGYLKGKHKGESYATVTSSDVPGLGSMTVVARHGVTHVKAGGQWATVPSTEGDATASPLASFDITRYVTDVRVDEGVQVGGEPMDRITGVIDTSAAVGGLLDTLGGAKWAGLAAATDTGAVGNIRAVIYVSERTHLPMRMLIDIPLNFGGETATIHMDLVITAVDKNVKIPSVG